MLLLNILLIELLLLLLCSSVLSFNNNIKHWNRSKGFVLNPTLLVQSSEKFIDKSKQTAFLKECSKTIANILGKPEQYVMISYKHVDGMIYAGNDELPSAFCHLASIGKIGPDYNPKVSNAICKILETHLNIKSNRVYIQFYDSSASNFGYDGSTFG